MPAYYALDRLNRVAPAYRGQAAIDRRTDRCGGFLATLRDWNDGNPWARPNQERDPARNRARCPSAALAAKLMRVRPRRQRLNACVRQSAKLSAKHPSARAGSISKCRTRRERQHGIAHRRRRPNGATGLRQGHSRLQAERSHQTRVGPSWPTRRQGENFQPASVLPIARLSAIAE